MKPLPFGLQIYEPGEFDAVHAAGSGILTGSNVSALFGFNRWTGEYALAAHLLGSVPFSSGDSPLKRRGRLMERLIAEMLAEKGYEVEGPEGGMYARHPTIANFLASPDRLLWKLDQPQLPPGLAEFKTVADMEWKKTWVDGDTGVDSPPLETELQTQAQYACCKGAEWGVIAALVFGSYTFELKTYPTQRNAAAVGQIERAARNFLGMLARGEMPRPDTHESTRAVLQALRPTQPGKEISLSGEDLEEARRQADSWQDAAEAVRIGKGIVEDAQAWFAAMADGASRIMIGNTRWVEIKEQHRRGYTVDPKTFETIKLKEVK
jgi:hypothetical protein